MGRAEFESDFLVGTDKTIPRFHESHIHQWTEIGGVQTHWIEAGKGPSLLMLHLLYSESAAFLKVFPYLQDQLHLISPDLPGIGANGKETELPGPHNLDGYDRFLVGFIDKMGFDKFNLLGSSAGGSIALWFARNHPERVNRLILQAAVVEPDFLMRVEKEFSRLRGSSKVWKTVMESDITAAAFFIIMRYFDPMMKKYNEPELRKFTRRLKKFSHRAGFELVTDIASKNLLEAAKEIRVPTLVIDGKDDIYPTLKQTRKLAQAIPNSCLVFISDADHNVIGWRPEEFADRVKRFLVRS